MMARYFISRVLVIFVVFAGLQSFLITGTLGKSTPKFSEKCHHELFGCALRASLPYIGLRNDEVLAKARATPLSKHCTDWGAAMDCIRQVARSAACLNATSVDTKKMLKFTEALDYVVNYACKENFSKFGRIYRCLLEQPLHTSVSDRCRNLEFSATDVCEKKPALIDCSAEGVAAQCGSEAGGVARELGPKLVDIMIEITYDKTCSPSNRETIVEVMKRYFSRK